MKQLHEGQWLTLGNYKEPMTRLGPHEGFGFKGALLQTEDGSKVQCHLCGKLFASLPLHLVKGHKIKPFNYRVRFNLSKDTSLISDDERDKRKEILATTLKGIGAKGRAAWTARAQAGLAKWQARTPAAKRTWKMSLQTKNERGTCTDQILAYLGALAVKHGRAPTYKEVGQRYGHLCYKVFGSFNNALKMLKLSTRRRGQGSMYTFYETDELIEYMKTFYKQNSRPPTFSDFKRPYLPPYQVYRRRFGGIRKARKAAGVPEPL